MDMKEIGGYLGLETFYGQEWYHDLIAVNSGRNALLYVLKAKNIRKLYIPLFLCDSIACLCEREGIEVSYYHIDEHFCPIFEKELSKDEYMYIVNYYGFFDNIHVNNFKQKYKNIIWDNAHAFFQFPLQNVDTLYTCRKFFGVPDGGYVSTESVLQGELECDVSKERMQHILGRYEGRASDYYQEFKENDMNFKALPLCYMSRLTKNIMSAIDYEGVKKKREVNYDYLHNELRELNGLNLGRVEGPYAYPFYIKNGMQLKKRLAERFIYVATLWPNALELDNCIEKDYAENILPLPCDQRYELDDMKRVVEEVKMFINKQ